MIVDEEHAGRCRDRSSRRLADLREGQHQLDLGSLAGASSAPSARPPARVMRPTIEWLMPPRSAGTVSGSKPLPAVADEDRRLVGLDLEVHRDRRRARVPGRVQDRLARRRQQAARSRRCPQSRTRTTSTGTPCSVSIDAASSSSAAPSERAHARGRRVAAEQPRAQLAFLHAREPHDLARLVGATLHERERLQHGVVQVRGDLGPLVGADAFAPFGDERVHEPRDARPDDERDADDHRDARRRTCRATRRHESTLTTNAARPIDHARDAGARSAPARRAGCRRSTATASAASGGSRRSSGQSGSSARRRARRACASRATPGRRARPPSGHTIDVAGPEPDRADQQQAAEHDRAERRGRDHVAAAALAGARRPRRRSASTPSRRRRGSTPRPLAIDSTTNPHRTTFGSRPSASASPAATPATMRPSTRSREVATTENTRCGHCADDRAERRAATSGSALRVIPDTGARARAHADGHGHECAPARTASAPAAPAAATARRTHRTPPPPRPRQRDARRCRARASPRPTASTSRSCACCGSSPRSCGSASPRTSSRGSRSRPRDGASTVVTPSARPGAFARSRARRDRRA